jgi:hypothetical protein
MNKQNPLLFIPDGRCTFRPSDRNRPFVIKMEIRDSSGKPTKKQKMCIDDVAQYLLKAG